MTGFCGSSDDDVPVAVWSGEIHGVKVYVLEDGRRIIDADDVHRLLSGELPGLDLEAFAVDFKRWADQHKSATRGQKDEG